MLAVLVLIIAVSAFIIVTFVCLIICRRLCDIEADIDSLEDRTDIHFKHLTVLWRERQNKAVDKTPGA